MSKTRQSSVDDSSLSRAVEDLQKLVSRMSEMVGGEPEGLVELDEPEVEASRPELWALAKREYAERSRRFSVLEVDLLGEPAWDILLDLFISDFERRRVSITSACIASNVPTTTGLRWLRLLEQRGLLERIVDTADGRRFWIQLSEAGRSLMEKLLAERLTAGCRGMFQKN